MVASMQGVTPKTSLGDNQARLRDFLIGQIATNGKSADRALGMLQGMYDPASQYYVALFNNQGPNSTNRLSQALNLMDTAPDTRGLKLAWQQAFNEVKTNQNDRVNLALRALRHPRLVQESVDVLAEEAQPRTGPFLNDLSAHWDQRIVEKAREGLVKVERNQRLLDLSNRLQSTDSADRINAAAELAATKDSRSIPNLIDAYMSAASQAEQDAIGAAVKRNISPEIWKFELRRRKGETGANTRVLDRLMQQKVQGLN
jgi:hypothetical protein